MTTSGKLNGLNRRRNLEHAIAQGVGQHRARLSRKIHGVVPIHRGAAFMPSAQGHLLHNLRVAGSATRAVLAHVVSIQ